MAFYSVVFARVSSFLSLMGEHLYFSNQTVDYGKGRKDKKQGKKGGSSNLASPQASDRGPPDLGALCI